MDDTKQKSERNHLGLYDEVQESFVSNLVRAIRVAGGISEKTGELINLHKGDLAEQSKLSKGTITKLTSSDPHDAKPDLETLCKLGSALNISPAFLLMTPRDWSLLLQAFGTIGSLVNSKSEHEIPLIKILEVAGTSQSLNEPVQAGLLFMKKMYGDDFSAPENARQKIGILAMTAMAQSAVRRQGSSIKMQATALGAILGNREITQN